ncbi:MAG: winged helix-turn-helix transcriptional regulator [Robiginitomaculum sp.]|nr:winged helix-turn-helix transcriptional regulator [Robiginitomaculum sp.]
MAIDKIILLTKKRWALPVLAVLAEGFHPRAYPLAQQLGGSRAAITQAILYLTELGLLTRHAGHGHPLRPELALTDKAKILAPAAVLAWRRMQENKILIPIYLQRWAFPVLACAVAPTKYAELRRGLPVTDRALSMSLKSLTQVNLLHREIDTQQYPPASYYRATPLGRRIVAPFEHV